MTRFSLRMTRFCAQDDTPRRNSQESRWNSHESRSCAGAKQRIVLHGEIRYGKDRNESLRIRLPLQRCSGDMDCCNSCAMAKQCERSRELQ